MGRDTASYRSPEYIRGKWEFQEGVLWEEIEKKVEVYENIEDVEDLNHHNAELLKLVQAQQWKWITLLCETKVALPQIREFDYTVDNIRTDHFLERYLEVDEIVGTVITSEIQFTSAVRDGHLTQLGFIFWQVISTHILPQIGHLNEFSIYVLVEVPFL